MNNIKVWDKIYWLCLRYYNVHTLKAIKVTKRYVYYWDKYNEKIDIIYGNDFIASRDGYICFNNRDDLNKYINSEIKNRERERFDLETQQLNLRKLIK